MNPKRGFLNRHVVALPKEKATIDIVHSDITYPKGETVLRCEWEPFKEEDYVNRIYPAEGYLGTANTVDPEFKTSTGFHAWEQNNSEFVYYKIINQKKGLKQWISQIFSA